MRDYGKISPQFWIGKSGKAMRGNVEAQIVALYLMTSPHAEMTGVFYCPVMYIAHETGLTMEGAIKGLQSLCDSDFCTFEADADTVFVHEMAKFQIGDDLKPNDNRVIGVQKIYANMPESPIRRGFYERYKAAFHLGEEGETQSPSKAPSKPETEEETETGKETGAGAREKTQRATRLPADWVAPAEYIDFCQTERPDLDPDAMQAKFRDYWVGVPGAKGTKLDWAGTWRNFIRSERKQPTARASPTYQTQNDKAKAWADRLTGKTRNDESTIIDISPAPLQLG